MKHVLFPLCALGHTKCGMGTRLPLGDGSPCRLSFLCIPVPVCFLEDLAILFANIAHFAFGGGDGDDSPRLQAGGFWNDSAMSSHVNISGHAHQRDKLKTTD